MIMVGASAYPRVIDFARISAVAQAVGAPMVVDMAHIAGLVAAGVHPSPVPHADFVTSTTHKTLRGPRAGLVLCREQYAKDLDRAVFPGRAGRAADAHHRGEGGLLQGSDGAVLRATTSARSSPTRSAWPQPRAHGFRLVSGGTDNHLMLVDVFSKGITGKAAEAALGKAGITVNKNAIPFDQNPPMVASGIRVGTPAVTTRGMREAEMDAIGGLIARVLAAPDDDRVAAHGEGRGRAAVPEVPAVPRADCASLRPPSTRRSPSAARSAASSTATSRATGSGGWPRPSPPSSNSGGTLLAEAGTGTGKTLAYLIPAILSRQRVLVSTGTKNLQEQIFFKDLPALQDALGVPFTATLMKGRTNYLCLHRWEISRRRRGNVRSGR